jgi:hypothetical protein
VDGSLAGAAPDRNPGAATSPRSHRVKPFRNAWTRRNSYGNVNWDRNQAEKQAYGPGLPLPEGTLDGVSSVVSGCPLPSIGSQDL